MSEGHLMTGAGGDYPRCMVGGCDEPQATLGPCQLHLDESIAEEERRDIEDAATIADLRARLRAVEALADEWFNDFHPAHVFGADLRAALSTSPADK